MLFCKYRLNSLVSSYAIVAITCGAVGGETPPLVSADRGLYPTGVYSVSEIESINDVNGSLALRIPLASLPPARAGHKADLGLTHIESLHKECNS